MSPPTPAPSPGRRAATYPRRFPALLSHQRHPTALSGLFLPVSCFTLALILILGIGQVAHPNTSSTNGSGTGLGYARQAAGLLRQYDRSIAEENRLLSLHDANPAVGTSSDWIRQSTEVLQALDSGYQQAQGLAVPTNGANLPSCLVDGFRLTSTGAHMLRDAYLTDGHGAYFLAAHGNWDLNLGAQRMAQCRALLGAPAAAGAPSPGVAR